MANYCHLSYEDRKNIEDGLNDNKSISQISIELNRSHSTILREIDRNKVYFEPKNYGINKRFDNPNYKGSGKLKDKVVGLRSKSELEEIIK